MVLVSSSHNHPTLVHQIDARPVLNSKEIRRHINSMPQARLNEKLFNQITGFLEDKAEIKPAK
jgi:hypothetical protein